MDPFSGGGSWSMIPSVQTHSNVSTPSNQDHLFLQQQQQQQQQFHYQQQQLQQQFHQQQQLQQQQRLLQQQQQSHHHQSLASHFHLLPVVENLADAVENGTRDQHSDALVNELNNLFEKCQQLLNSSGSIITRTMTVEGQKRKLEESEQLLNQRRDLIAKYRNSIEDVIQTEP